jgi:hypothetical protein
MFGIHLLEKHELQTSYFQKAEVSLHVSIIYRHAILEYDHVDSTEENPNIVAEHFFVVIPDPVHDNHFTYDVLLNRRLHLEALYRVKIRSNF